MCNSLSKQETELLVRLFFATKALRLPGDYVQAAARGGDICPPPKLPLILKWPDNPENHDLLLRQVVHHFRGDWLNMYDVIVGIPESGNPIAEQLVQIHPELQLARMYKSKDPSRTFEIATEDVQNITGKRVLLLENVITTASSAVRAVRCVRAAGAQRIDVATVLSWTHNALRVLSNEGAETKALVMGVEVRNECSSINFPWHGHKLGEVLPKMEEWISDFFMGGL